MKRTIPLPVKGVKGGEKAGDPVRELVHLLFTTRPLTDKVLCARVWAEPTQYSPRMPEGRSASYPPFMFNVWLFPMFICILPPCSSFLFVQSVIIWSASFDAVHPMLCAASVNFFFVSGAILIVSTSVFFIVFAPPCIQCTL